MNLPHTTTPFRYTRNGIVQLTRAPSYEEADAEVATWASLTTKDFAAVGSLLNQLQGQFGEIAAQFERHFPENTYGKLARWKSVMKRIHPDCLDITLTFSKLEAVAKLPHERQLSMLQQAELEAWSGKTITAKIADPTVPMWRVRLERALVYLRAVLPETPPEDVFDKLLAMIQEAEEL